ncbi:MAG: siderophore-interacting protein [Propionibacteriaceae bacterium]|nr:siderophore-interacting protein [Propionibacteriaceae bacterium]
MTVSSEPSSHPSVDHAETSAQAPRARVKDHEVEVVDVCDLTPWYRRVTVDACGLFESFHPAPGAYLLLNVPGLDDDRVVQRAYSLHSVSSDGFCLDVVLHAPEGPGSAWAARAVPGTRVSVSEAPYALTVPDVPHAVLIADTSAVPAVASLIEGCEPAMAMTVILQDAHPDRDLITLPTRPGVRIAWVDEVTPHDLRDATTGIDPTACFLWAAGERRLAKTVREFARHDFAIPRQAQHVQTYWIAETETP